MTFALSPYNQMKYELVFDPPLLARVCPDQHDIYGHWISPDGTISGSPRKITTWRPGVENKILDIPLPVPTSLRDCLGVPSVRLVLWAGASQGGARQNDPDTISLPGPRFGHSPFPVLSLPIQLIGTSAVNQKKSKGGPRVQKQEQIERRLLLPARPEGLDPLGTSNYLTLREETSYDLDKVVCSFTQADFC